VHDAVVWIQEVLVPTLGPFGLFLVALLDSSLLTIPEINDILVVTWSQAEPRTAWVPILMATLGSLMGSSILWSMGRAGGEKLLLRRFGPEKLERTRAAYRRFDVLALAIPAMLPPPLPFKIFVLSAGVFGYSFPRFAITLLVARGLRYSFWGAMGILFGGEALALLRAFDAWFEEQTLHVLLPLGATLAVILAMWLLRRRARAAAGDA
jgi:membrane protein YqaA with SNARE-associated domain